MTRTARVVLFLLLPMTVPTLSVQADEPPVETVEIKGQTFKIYPYDRLRERGVRVPEIAHDDNAAFRYFDAINATLPAEGDLDNMVRDASSGNWPADPATEQQLIAYIDANARALELASEAAAMPDYYLPLFGDAGDPLYALLLPSLSDQRQLARLFVIDAERHIRAGDYQTGMNRLLSAQHMGGHLGHGTTMIEGLVGVAITALVSDQTNRLAETYDIPTDVLIDTTAAMASIADNLPSFDDMLRAEEALTDQIVEDVMINPTVGGQLIGVPAPPSILKPANDSGWYKLLKELRRVYLPDRAVKRHAKKYYQKVREGTRPRKDGTPGTILEEDQLIKEVPTWDVLTAASLPSFSRVHEMVLMNNSNFERARVRLALQAYQQDQGHLPPNLQALTPTYLARVPADPMTGYDFDYQPTIDEDGAPAGLTKVTRDSAEELRKKRRTPAILTPRASKWRRVVMRFADRYQFDERQRASAEGILRDVEARAAAFERTQGAKIQQLIDEGDHSKAKTKMGPLDQLFDELERRLNKLPTRKQRAAVQSEAAAEGK